ncbi:uncharacterized protein LOC119668950 isoform X2 [Teleopsis dalmanni]|uniref:uncharacterized protein LOC119668950 isoform X2 n=1 Tax=Teleopsis dalmanni TaxID=139649 RepID=UPI0018CF87B1|nr:uncharacterized protein LOC119668950 isoform X2 [Teleopsis dalmanni]
MSDTVRNDISTESICTVIENSIESSIDNKLANQKLKIENELNGTSDCAKDIQTSEAKKDNHTNGFNTEDSSDHCNESAVSNCDTSTDQSTLSKTRDINSKARSKLKKSVSFDPADEKIKKFIAGDPIVDQQNPFKNHFNTNGSLKKKKVPPPVPTKRSTLSIRKTVTQQLREREREKEKERERLKNETNNRKSSTNNQNGTLSSPDEFVTTEEVLRQSKYVKTYIKNPDPYFVYDPTVLARIKFEELRELSEKKPPKKLKLTTQTRERLKDLKNKQPIDTKPSSLLPFKKCSKPNYPELSDIKVKVGTEPDGNYFNPAEVTKNAKKFDERVKKLHISSDDDLDEIDEPLTKSESSDEVVINGSDKHQDSIDTINEIASERNAMNAESSSRQPADGTFTNTISSKEFQNYLDKKGLTLIPRKVPNGAQPLYGDQQYKSGNHITFKAPERVQISLDTVDLAKNSKKPSVFQRLLSNSIFASRRKTTPKETVPNPRRLYDAYDRPKENGNVRNAQPIKRVVLERQSFHGRPRVGNLLSASETNELKQQTERMRKSFASGDDLSLSISSALTNAEYANEPDSRSFSPLQVLEAQHKPEILAKPIVKPPRRTLSRDRLSNMQSLKQPELQNSTKLKSKTPQGQVGYHNSLSLPKAVSTSFEKPSNADGQHFRRTMERQSLIPKRSTQLNDKQQLFGRSSSMDRNEILKRSTNRGLQNRSKSANETRASKVLTSSGDNLLAEFSSPNGPTLTSTPIRAVRTSNSNINVNPLPTKNSIRPQNGVYVDQSEWEKLRAIKEQMDRELYNRVLQQQQQQHQQQLQVQQQLQQCSDVENIYERLPSKEVLVPPSIQASNYQQSQHDSNFVRSSPQRNTFSGVIRNRQTKIIDGRTIFTPDQKQVLQPVALNGNPLPETTPRSQSVLDGMIQGSRSGFRRGYESDTDTSVILRRKNMPENIAPPRRIGGILTREEILQKVKEFCRKSLNKTPTNQSQIQTIYEKQPLGIDLSPVSYASVETHQRPGSRMYAAPQVPQRMQSLPQQFIPITREVLTEENATNSPIYAHVIKRSSLQSNHSELYDSPQRPYLIRRESDTQPFYVRRGTLQRTENNLMPTHYYSADYYAQPQYVRPNQLQQIPGSYGYITVQEPVTHQLRPRLQDGRSTPLILDRSSQQASQSQIYWTPQHQRLQQHAELLPVQISPRYMPKQQSYLVPVAVPAKRPDEILRAKQLNGTSNTNIPAIQQFTPIIHNSTPTTLAQQSVMHARQTSLPVAQPLHNVNNSYEWESGSEAGEVQSILERQKNSDIKC